MKRDMYTLMVSACLSALLISPALADQTQIPNYRKARDDFFWPQAYPHGGFTFYCGQEFTDKIGL